MAQEKGCSFLVTVCEEKKEEESFQGRDALLIVRSFFTSTKASFGAGMFRRFKQERKTVKKFKSNSLSNHIQHI